MCTSEGDAISKLRHIRPEQLLIAALTLIGVGILTLALRDVVREAVVIPLAYAAWMTDLALKSLPQSIFLAVLVIAGLFIVLRGFSQTSARSAEMPFRPVDGGVRSRFKFWARQFDNLDHSQFAREQAAQEMRNLVLRTLAHVHQLDPSEVMPHVRSSALSVPLEIEALLLDWQGWMSDQRLGEAPRPSWRRLLKMLFPTQRQTADRAARLNGKLATVIDYVEAQLGNST